MSYTAGGPPKTHIHIWEEVNRTLTGHPIYHCIKKKCLGVKFATHTKLPQPGSKGGE